MGTCTKDTEIYFKEVPVFEFTTILAAKYINTLVLVDYDPYNQNT